MDASPPPAADAPSPFWTFSLAVYDRPGVAPACLALQDELGLDVNVLLLALYAGTRGIVLDEAAHAALDAEVAAWRAGAVHPLRAVRRWIRQCAQQAAGAGNAAGGAGPWATPAYRAVQQAELAAERAQQLAMEQWLAARAQDARAAPGDIGRANLHAYLRWMHCRADAGTDARLHTLLQAAYGPGPGRAPPGAG